MRASQALRRDDRAGVDADLAHYWREGYAIVRGFFDAAEIAEIGAALDQLYAEGAAHGRCFRHGNLFYNVAREQEGSEPLVRMVQWPSYHQPVLNGVRLDTRFADLLEPLIGSDLKQIINQVHWKAPGSLGDFAWHQDSRFRQPASAYRNLATSYVQTGLAIDPHTTESGCMRIVPRSHLRGELEMDCSKKALGTPMSERRAGRRRPVGRRCGRPAARARRSRAVEPVSGPRLGQERLRAQAPAVHQRLCPGIRLRPRRMGVSSTESGCHSGRRRS